MAADIFSLTHSLSLPHKSEYVFFDRYQHFTAILAEFVTQNPPIAGSFAVKLSENVGSKVTSLATLASANISTVSRASLARTESTISSISARFDQIVNYFLALN